MITRTYKLTLLLIMALLTMIFAGCQDKSLQSRRLVKEGIDLLYKTNMEQALKNFEHAARLDPRNHEAWFYIGVIYQNRRNYQQAIEFFTKAIEEKEDYADAYYNRGLCWFYLGDRHRSCNDWIMAEDLGKDNINDRTDKCRQDMFF